MSEPSDIGSTAPGHYGVASASGNELLAFRQLRIAAGWNLQGDPFDPTFMAQVRRSFAIDGLPAANTTCETDLLRVFWLGPTSWLLLARGPVTDSHPLARLAVQREAVNHAAGALFDLSAARVAWQLSGPRAATVLASGCPLDLHPRVFPAGACAQSLFGHVGALVVCGAEREFSLFVARSLAGEAWWALCATGAQYGYEVLPPGAF